MNPFENSALTMEEGVTLEFARRHKFFKVDDYEIFSGDTRQEIPNPQGTAENLVKRGYLKKNREFFVITLDGQRALMKAQQDRPIF